MQKGKKGTSRMSVFRDLAVPQSYTFEASFKGGNFMDEFEIKDYEKMGTEFFSILGNFMVRKYHVRN